MTRPVRLYLFVSVAALALGASHAVAEPAPMLPLPPCEMEGETMTGACPDTSESVSLAAPGVFGEGVTLTFEPAPITACTEQDIFADFFTPAPCYSEIRGVSVGFTCYYIDLRDDEFKQAPCSEILYVDPQLLPDRLFSYEGQRVQLNDASLITTPNACSDRFNEVYIFGGPANVPGARWSERAAAALPCRATFNGPRPDGLYGPTWVLATATIIVRDDTQPETERAQAFVPIDGDLRELGEVEMDIESTEMEITGYRGADFDTLEYGLITAYGETYTRIELESTTEEGDPLPEADVRLSIEGLVGDQGARMGLSTSRAGSVGADVLNVRTDDEGTATVWLLTDDLYRAQSIPANVTLLAQLGASTSTDDVLVTDNLQSLIQRYETANSYIPDGARNLVRTSLRPPVGAIDAAAWIGDTFLRFGNANLGRAWDERAGIFCQTYQSLSLIFLNEIRHDPDRAFLINGLDYAPVQVVGTDHHYVIVYPSSEGQSGVQPSVRIFDPWPSQTGTVYTLEEYSALPGLMPWQPDVSDDPDLPGTCYQRCKSNLVDGVIPFPYPLAGGVYPYFASNEGKPPFGSSPSDVAQLDGCFAVPVDWCQQNGFSGDAVRVNEYVQREAAGALVIASPVVFHLDYGDGQRYGFVTPDEFENTLQDALTGYAPFPEPEGDRGWYVDLPLDGPFELTLTATGDGLMSALVARADGTVWGTYQNVPLETGQQYSVRVDFEQDCAPLNAAGSAGADCLCGDVDDDGVVDPCPGGAAADGGGGGGCSTATAPSQVTWCAWMLVLLALVRRRATTFRDER